MKNRSIARRYAKIFMKIEQDAEESEAFGEELSLFSRLLDRSPSIRTFFLVPVISKQRKQKILQLLCSKAKISEQVRRFLSVLLDNDRLGLLDEIRIALKEMEDAKNNIVAVEITTAEKIHDDLTRKLRKLFTSITGKNVRLNMRVDPDIIGGVIARVGSTVYDGAIRSQLLRMKDRVLGE